MKLTVKAATKIWQFRDKSPRAKHQRAIMADRLPQHVQLFRHDLTLSHCVIDGRYAFVSGQLATEGRRPPPIAQSAEAETRLCMEQIAGILGSVGLTLENIVRVNLYVVDLPALNEIFRAFATFFPSGKFPALTCVGVAGLIGGCKVEITAAAAFPAGFTSASAEEG
ncbi:Endoribonuclease L-PSP/chorismate mutase-like protein [Zopfochytrium polystomum]|nr:Endoribonuclease L-PSP/chorismate mutase-like protein [Zopfochytrium polystomum]